MLYIKTVSLEFVLFLFAVVHCKGPPKLLRPVKPQYTVQEGQTVKLRCKFSGTKDPAENRTLTAWQKLPEGRYIIDKFSRFRMRPGYLKIKKVKKSDQGTYACIAHNLFGKVKREILLVVKASNSSISTQSAATNPIPSTSALSISAKEPPILSTTKRPPRKGRLRPSKIPLIDEYPPKFKAPDQSRVRFMEYVKGLPIRLKCHATGAPPLNVTWLKNGKPLSRADRKHLKSKGWVINIFKLSYNDAGTYTCTVRNAFGSIEKAFVVKVVETQVLVPREEKPKILRNVLKNQTATEGEDATFVCSAIAKSHPDFHFLKWKSSRNVSNGSELFEFVDFKKSKFQEFREIAKQHMGNRKIYTHRFIVRNVTLADEARYTCVVGNSVGFVSHHVFLTVMTQEGYVSDEGYGGGVGSQSTMTKAPRKSPAPQEDKEILVEEVPLAALIGVPIAVLILLIGTIVWCYFMTRKHHSRKHWEGVDKSSPANDLSKKGPPSQVYATKKEETRNVSFNIYVDCPDDKESPPEQQIRTHVKCDSPHGKCTIVRDPPLDGLIVHSEPPRTHSNRTNHRKRHEREELEFIESSGSEIKCSGV